ncbi:MAG: aldolase/citrate lyase family protein [Anaerotignum sp.]|nr:aldolase/citrate lyase family protein [Anaerotignum sp.]
MSKDIRQKLQDGEKVVGTFFEIGGSTAVECLGLSGLDFFIIDTEHGPFDVESSANFIRAAELRKIAPFVRIRDATRPSVLKMLDIGAKALIVPCINSVEEVQKLVEYGKYYPVGMRGFAPTRAGGFGFEEFAADINHYFEFCNKTTMIIPQCETLGCLEHIEEITAIEGVDGIFIGPYDLSCSFGKPGQFNDPEIVHAFDRVVKACKAAGKFVLIYAGSEEVAKKYLEDGFDGVAYNMDAIVYINAYKNIIKNIKS